MPTSSNYCTHNKLWHSKGWSGGSIPTFESVGRPFVYSSLLAMKSVFFAVSGLGSVKSSGTCRCRTIAYATLLYAENVVRDENVHSNHTCAVSRPAPFVIRKQRLSEKKQIEGPSAWTLTGSGGMIDPYRSNSC